MIGRFDQSPAGPFMIAILLAVVFLIGPLLFGVAGVRHAARGPGQDGAPRTWEGRLVLRSALLYTLAFNLTFFLQELFLVLPKALTPGLKPTLFHNNHTWQGDSPWVGLLQGSGALAIFVSGVLCALLVRRCAARSRSLRLFLTWMAYCGLFQSLPQVMIGSVNPLNDVGMALHFLQLGALARGTAALVALLLMPLAAWCLTRDFLETATQPLAGPRARMAYVFQVATLPALLAVPLIVLFRIPRELIEVLAVPAVVSVIGTVWVQACAWRETAVRSPREAQPPLGYLVAAAIALLLVFQLVLRRGIAFY